MKSCIILLSQQLLQSSENECAIHAQVCVEPQAVSNLLTPAQNPLPSGPGRFSSASFWLSAHSGHGAKYEHL